MTQTPSFPDPPAGVSPQPRGVIGPFAISDSEQVAEASDSENSIGCSQVPLGLDTDVYPAGVNGALRRTPSVDVSGLSLLERTLLNPAWKARRPKIETFGVTFPEGVLLLPPKPEATGGKDLLRRLDPPAAVDSPPDPHVDLPERPRRTKLRPPSDALTLQDRLFYLLQPPLESWLAGQELVMPFEPFPFQYEGIAWLFSQKSALLADEMGLGKTMQAITAIRLLMRSGQARRVLLVCPKPLIPNWNREFKLWAEELPVMTLEGDAGRRRMLWTMPGISVLIANYELMSRDLEDFASEELPQFDLLVLDEAQRIKNRESRTAQVARSIPRRRSWALTGTPIENRPEELVSLYEFIKVVPPRAACDLKQLQRLSKTYILRRTKDLVMTDLPPRLDRDEYLELTPAQQLAYKTAEQEGVIHLDELGESISVQHVFELVLRLKQITNFDPLTGESAKLERLLAEMEEIAQSNGKAILFSQWTKSLDWLKERLGAFGPLVYHGGVPTPKREPILKRFQEDADSHLLLMSYGTGAVGLNLQFAGYVFLFDRWWNPAVEDQAINRAHRIGQKSQVIVTRFICKDTIEERIDTVLRQKRELFESVLGDGKTTNASLSLTASEIFGLFGLKARDAKRVIPTPPPSTTADENTAAA
ncbi:MAG TPA: DEAD/DEAH box helicase [Planctomycetaceae bacterium]|nr:DEAD/DEAH box helicase [Planctomycetaceae bacterium]